MSADTPASAADVFSATGEQTWRDRYVTAADGIRLYARDYGADQPGRVPVVCLCGLTRTSREFHVLASHLAKTRRVICPDYRGRGRSGHTANWQTYMPVKEMADALLLLDQIGVGKVFVIGTSRGGMIAMLMALMHRPRLAGVVFNDIGPVIDRDGLARIVQYVGRMPDFAGWPDAIAALKKVSVGFEALGDDDWDYFARMTFAEVDGRPIADYDPNLSRTMPKVEQIQSGAAPDMWPAFEALGGLPVSVIRGEHSDLLSVETVDHMNGRLDGLHTVTIADRGHTPFLTEPDAIAAIDWTLELADEEA